MSDILLGRLLSGENGLLLICREEYRLEYRRGKSIQIFQSLYTVVHRAEYVAIISSKRLLFFISQKVAYCHDAYLRKIFKTS
jgi:hypothetical protein